MRPVPIPDELVQPGTVRRLVQAPPGEEDVVRPVESLISADTDGTALLSMMMKLEDGDIEKLQAGGRIWLTMRGGIIPFSVHVLDEGQVP